MIPTPWLAPQKRLFELQGSWLTFARCGAAFVPFLVALVLLANKDALAHRIAGPGDDETGATIPLACLKRAGFACVGVMLVMHSLLDAAAFFGEAYAWVWPLQLEPGATMTSASI